MPSTLTQSGPEILPGAVREAGPGGRLQANLSGAGLRRKALAGFIRRSDWVVARAVARGTKRAVDLLLAALCALLLAPIFVAAYGAARRKGGGLASVPHLGRGGEPFPKFCLCFHRGEEPGGAGFLSQLPALANVLRGEMSLVGPRPFRVGEVNGADRWAWRRFAVKPGFFCLWWLRSRGNIAYRPETENDAEYVDGHSVSGDLGILLRSLPAALYGESSEPARGRMRLLGIPIDNVSLSAAVDFVAERCAGARSGQVCFINADCVNIAGRDRSYRAVLEGADLVLADGIGVKLAGRLLGQQVRQNVNGTDLLPPLCARLAALGKRIYLLGGRPGVASAVAAWMRRSYPGLQVAGWRDGFFQPAETAGLVDAIRASAADVLLVAFGAPKQEKWIAEFLPATGCRVGIGVGGLFDFYAGRVPRAPLWMREIGMEWLFRLGQEPLRLWKRYLWGNLLFLARVCWARLSSGRGKAGVRAGKEISR